MPWNRWPHLRGTGGHMFMESMATCAWNTQPHKEGHQHGCLSASTPIALDAVKRFDAIFNVERGITGLTAEARHDARQRLVHPTVCDL